MGLEGRTGTHKGRERAARAPEPEPVATGRGRAHPRSGGNDQRARCSGGDDDATHGAYPGREPGGGGGAEGVSPSL